jgi:hypothetical protein
MVAMIAPESDGESSSLARMRDACFAVQKSSNAEDAGDAEEEKYHGEDGRLREFRTAIQLSVYPASSVVGFSRS